MTNGHQATATTAPTATALEFGRAQALRLPRSAQPRCLRVTAGRVWLTRSGAGPEGEDIWLSAGERLALPAGTEWVAEGWPDARAEVVVSASAPASSSLWSAWSKRLAS